MRFIISRKHLPPTRSASAQPSAPALSPRRHAAVATALLLPAVSALAQSGGTALPAVNVEAAREPVYKAARSASRKYDQPLLETPQSITIIKRALTEQQAATTLTEALRNSPGVGTFFLGENGSTNTGDAIFMRGFDVSSSIFVDNVRDLGAISRDLFNIEQVEVLKGAAGSDNGRGAPTGAINLISKQPDLHDTLTASASYGSWNQKRTTVDWNKVLDQDRGLALRLNLMKQDSGVPGRHEVRNARQGIAPSLALGLGSATRIVASYLHIDHDNVPDGGVPTIGLPGYTSPDPRRPAISAAPRVNPSNFYGNVNDFNRIANDMLTLRVDHDFSPTLKLQNTTRHARTDQDYRPSSFIATGTDRPGIPAGLITPAIDDRATWRLARNIVTRRDQLNQISTNQTHVSAQLDTGPLQHALSGGLELTQEKQDALSFTRTGSRPDANLYRPDPRFSEAGLRIDATGHNEGKTDTVSVYLMDTVRIDERWSINAGVRADQYRTRFNSVTPTSRTHLTDSGRLLNWKLAALFKPTRDSSLYALYATSQQPPGSANFSLSANRNSAANPDYAPQAARTAELGAKWDLLERRLGLTAALYRTELRNEIELDNSTGLYFQNGKKRVQGLELSATGELTRELAITAGYALMGSRVTSGANVSATGENVLAYAPSHSFVSWASWRLPQGLTIGGGARYSAGLVRSNDRNATGTPQRTGAYWVVDAMASYAITPRAELQLNISNLFNTDYVAAINRSGYRYTPGTTRSVMLTGNFRY